MGVNQSSAGSDEETSLGQPNASQPLENESHCVCYSWGILMTFQSPFVGNSSCLQEYEAFAPPAAVSTATTTTEEVQTQSVKGLLLEYTAGLDTFYHITFVEVSILLVCPPTVGDEYRWQGHSEYHCCGIPRMNVSSPSTFTGTTGMRDTKANASLI